MANNFSRVTNYGTESHFSQAVTGELAFSRMVSAPQHITAFNAGDIVPLYCMEVLPHDTFKVDTDFVIRQTTLLTPTMGAMDIDIYAFFVPNRVVNRSWKVVQGENPNGSWTAPEVNLATLVGSGTGFPSSYSVPVGSVADYYGFPTQAPIPSEVLQQCHDLKFRGYIEIYNEFFRDQNYQPPIPYSKLNVYEGFFDYVPAQGSSPVGSVALDGSERTSSEAVFTRLDTGTGELLAADGSVGAGAINQAVYGNNASYVADNFVNMPGISRSSVFNALGPPLVANKLHDYFTSVLPSPQKGPQVLLPLSGNAPVLTSLDNNTSFTTNPLRFRNLGSAAIAAGGSFGAFTSVSANGTGIVAGSTSQTSTTMDSIIAPSNLYADLSQVAAATLSDLRMAAAVQQVYESLARGGSRYREFVRTMFGLEVDNPYEDIPTCLGHVRRELDLYQTAQTGASESGSTPQGNLAAFGYTANGGFLFEHTFLEHGYVHILGVVRHRNLYSSFLARDNFRLTMLDWYLPQLANISEQPVYAREINPFGGSNQVFGYQEAWAEYRYDPDYVTGYMRPFGTGTLPNDARTGQPISGSLALWNYADDFNDLLTIASGSWLKSNSREVLDRSLAVTSALSPQLKGQFRFRIDKERPMPTYSVPGLDIF